MGEKQYANVEFTGNGEYIKSMLYILGANHGQFNELWGNYDLYNPANYFLNVKNFLTEEEQQKIAKIFIKTFLEVTLLEDKTYVSLFSDVWSYQEALPSTAYEQVYQDSAFLCLADFEEDADVKNGTMEQVTISTEGMDNWHEGRRVIGSGYDGENEQTALRPRVVLVDENNHQTVADSAATVFPTWKVQLQKLDILFQQYEYKHHFQTVIVEPEDFSAKDEDFDMEHVKEIRIEFSGEQDGDIHLDDIGLEYSIKNY